MKDINVLVINCGSSSLKFQLINSKSEAVIAKGLCERIGIEGSQMTYTPAGGVKQETVTPMKDHTEAIRLVLGALTDKENGVVKSLDEIGAVGHRLVHGGENFASSTLITDEVIKAIEECNGFGASPQSGEPDRNQRVQGTDRPIPLWREFLIRRSTRQCRRRLIFMVFLITIMRITR